MRIRPTPPVADLALPWDAPVTDAVAAVAAARAEHGDTFAAVSGGDTYLFCFSPTGVDSFYALPEEVASKGVADYLMLRRKLPDEVFDGRRTCPAQPFSLAAMSTAATRLLTSYDVEPAWAGRPRPVPAQIGGVARAEGACEVRYRARPSSAATSRAGAVSR